MIESIKVLPSTINAREYLNIATLHFKRSAHNICSTPSLQSTSLVYYHTRGKTTKVNPEKWCAIASLPSKIFRNVAKYLKALAKNFLQPTLKQSSWKGQSGFNFVHPRLLSGHPAHFGAVGGKPQAGNPIAQYSMWPPPPRIWEQHSPDSFCRIQGGGEGFSVAGEYWAAWLPVFSGHDLRRMRVGLHNIYFLWDPISDFW